MKRLRGLREEIEIVADEAWDWQRVVWDRGVRNASGGVPPSV